MAKVNLKIKWHGPTSLTFRLSGNWLDVVKGLHEAGSEVVRLAKLRGLVSESKAETTEGLPGTTDSGSMGEASSAPTRGTHER